MSPAEVVATVAFGILIVNGLRVTLGVPPFAYWFRSRTCPLCEGVGFLRAHTHTGETIDLHVEAAIRKLAESRVVCRDTKADG